MKWAVIILLFSTSTSIASAQFSESHHAVYVAGALSLGNYLGLDASLNYVYKNKYSFKIGYIGNIRTASSKPQDYRYGLETIFLIANPYDILATWHIGIGKIYNLNPSGTIRLNASVGLGYTVIREAGNWEKIVDPRPLTRNYDWSYNESSALSLIINPKIEFLALKFWGVTLSPMIKINKDRTYVGIGIGSIVGKLSGGKQVQKTKE